MAMRNQFEAGESMADMAMMGSGPESIVVHDSLGDMVAHFTRYQGWPELKEAMIAGRVQAAYLLAPLAMDLADKGIPVRVVALGHRSGAVIMVKKDDPARNLGDLRGRRIGIPSRFAVDYLYLRRLMREHNLRPSDVTLIELAPPEMPAALYAGAVDAYATGEPWGAKAEREGLARVLHWTRQDWPDYICCVLAVREDMIQGAEPVVQRLVDDVMSAGVWLDRDTVNRNTAAVVASRPEFFNTDSLLLQYVLNNPVDRVTYGDLRLIREQLDELMQLGVEAGVLTRPVAYETYADERFIRRRRYRNVDIRR
jgi:NitT/TauT family transport system substrate-binding protein